MPLSSLQPRLLWQYFHQLTQIPRPTYREAAVQQFVLDEAARLGLAAERDEAGNIVVRKPASAGMEGRSGVILQSHLDMVPQKNQDSSRLLPQHPSLGNARAGGQRTGYQRGTADADGEPPLEQEGVVREVLPLLLRPIHPNPGTSDS